LGLRQTKRGEPLACKKDRKQNNIQGKREGEGEGRAGSKTQILSPIKKQHKRRIYNKKDGRRSTRSQEEGMGGVQGGLREKKKG